jgi:hypothetical protein
MEAKPRRFTGRELMIMFIVLCATAVLIPTAAWAVSTGSSVNIVDPTTATSKAAVESTGRLKVDTGLNSVYGLVPTITTGSVTANVAYPTASIVQSNDGAGNPVLLANTACSSTCTKLVAPPAGSALVITAIHVDTFLNASPGSTAINIVRSSNGSCSFASIETTMERVSPGGIGVTDLQYPVPGGMVVSAGKALCLDNGNPAVLDAYVTAWGYSVPSAAVPAAKVAALPKP